MGPLLQNPCGNQTFFISIYKQDNKKKRERGRGEERGKGTTVIIWGWRLKEKYSFIYKGQQIWVGSEVQVVSLWFTFPSTRVFQYIYIYTYIMILKQHFHSILAKQAYGLVI